VARNAGRLKFSRPDGVPYPTTMAKAPIQRFRPQNLRILSLLRKQAKRVKASPNSILAENGNQLTAESGAILRTEQ